MGATSRHFIATIVRVIATAAVLRISREVRFGGLSMMIRHHFSLTDFRLTNFRLAMMVEVMMVGIMLVESLTMVIGNE